MLLLPLGAAALVAAIGSWAAWRFHAPASDTPRERQLAHAKRRATLLLVGAAAGFLATFSVPHAFWAQLLRTGFEAAMVGAVADALAVTALFQRIWLVGESDIVARQKDAIGDELAAFVKDKFLDAESLAALIRKHDLAQAVADWLLQPANTRRVADLLVTCVSGALQMLEAERIQQLLKDAVRALVASVDLSRTTAQVLEALTAEGRHQQLLDQLIARMLEACSRPELRAAIADKIVAWLRTEHKVKQMVLPTEWLGEKGSEVIAANLGQYLLEVRSDPTHQLRVAFDAQVRQLVERLQADPLMQQKAEEIKSYLLNDEALARYAGQLWATLSGWIRQDIAAADSLLHRQLQAAAGWLARELGADAELRRTLDDQLEAVARSGAPQFAEFLTRHIRDTVHQWDAHSMTHQVELAIGARLQKIRINGTAMGFVIGLLLFLAAEAAERWLVR